MTASATRSGSGRIPPYLTLGDLHMALPRAGTMLALSALYGSPARAQPKLWRMVLRSIEIQGFMWHCGGTGGCDHDSRSHSSGEESLHSFLVWSPFASRSTVALLRYSLLSKKLSPLSTWALKLTTKPAAKWEGRKEGNCGAREIAQR